MLVATKFDALAIGKAVKKSKNPPFFQVLGTKKKKKEAAKIAQQKNTGSGF